MKAILLSGVHGVGKSFLLENMKTALSEYIVYSASSLIEKYKVSADAGYKKVRDVKKNQQILIEAIKHEMVHGHNNFIIDGHLCLLNANNDVERIPEFFFEQTGISNIILLQDDPVSICDRIRGRDGQSLSIEIIDNLQSNESIYADELKQEYGMNILRISPKDNYEDIVFWLKNVGNESE